LANSNSTGGKLDILVTRCRSAAWIAKGRRRARVKIRRPGRARR
jgi:hypothetical protein